MKNRFYIILTLLLILLTSCSEEKSEKKYKNEISKEENRSKTVTKKSNLVLPISKKAIEYQFVFKNLENQSTKLLLKNDIYNFTNIKQPIVMVSLFSTWCPPCIGQLPHLSSLQKKFKENLFILSALVYDDRSNKELKKFMIAQKVSFFISHNQKENLKFAQMITPKLGLPKDDFPLPLMILFLNGKYFTHYEGIMPEEMIESDIKQALKKLKGKS